MHDKKMLVLKNVLLKPHACKHIGFSPTKPSILLHSIASTKDFTLMYTYLLLLSIIIRGIDN